MQENDFEKQVQQKMEELQFAPSEPVWQKVELQIGKEKRKRRLVLLLLPLLLVTGGAIWYASSLNNDPSKINSNNNNQQNTSTNFQKKPATNTTNNEPALTPAAPVIKPKGYPPATDAMANHTKKGQKGFETFLNKTKEKSRTNKGKTVTSIRLAKERAFEINEDLHALVLENEMEKRASAIAEKKAVDEKNVSKAFRDSAAKKEETNVAVVTSDSSRKESDAATAEISETATGKDSAQVEATLPPEIPTTIKMDKQARPWEWTLTARAGATHLRNGVLNVFSNERADNMYASPTMGNNNPATGSGGTGNSNSLNSISNEIEKSFAFSIGAGVRKKLFQNAFVTAGLQYSRYSTRAAVGNIVVMDTTISYNGRTTSISSYYRATGTPSTYTTHYHYLELPLAFEYRLLKRVPLQVQHGISVGYLLASNALYFDPGARVLYKNDRWLRNTGWHLFTSVDYRLLKTPSIALFLGPQVQWSLSPLQQPQEANKHYLFFTGVQSRITF